jgi:hypothetical protein
VSGWALAPGPEIRGDPHRDEGRRVPGRVPGDEEGPTAVQMRALIVLVMLLAWLAANVLPWWSPGPVRMPRASYGASGEPQPERFAACCIAS